MVSNTAFLVGQPGGGNFWTTDTSDYAGLMANGHQDFMLPRIEYYRKAIMKPSRSTSYSYPLLACLLAIVIMVWLLPQHALGQSGPNPQPSDTNQSWTASSQQQPPD